MTLHLSLKGGLGNQLFQFATAVELCISSEIPLCLHWAQPRGATKRQFNLNFLGLETCRVYKVDVKNGINFQFISKHSPVQSIWAEKIHESSLKYNEIQLTSPEVKLYGFFQSWRYFQRFNDPIKKFINFRLVSSINSLIDKEIEGKTLIHIRFGDYLTSGPSQIYTNLNQNYYIKALDALKAEKDSIICVTDDIKNAKILCGKILGRKIRTLTSKNSLLDLYYLSHAGKLVIANSTYSWWGAFLNSNSPVIAPNSWFLEDNYRGFDYSNLVLPSWIRI